MGKKENLGKAVFEMFGVGGEKNKNVSEESTLVISEIPDPPPEKQKIFKKLCFRRAWKPMEKHDWACQNRPLSSVRTAYVS